MLATTDAPPTNHRHRLGRATKRLNGVVRRACTSSGERSAPKELSLGQRPRLVESKYLVALQAGMYCKPLHFYGRKGCLTTTNNAESVR
jgi:hypothetical protein